MNNKLRIQSGEKLLEKLTKTQVHKHIKETGSFKGYMCGNKVNPAHIADGWHLGFYVECDNIESFNQEFEKFDLGLHVYTPELGTYPHYYRIVE